MRLCEFRNQLKFYGKKGVVIEYIDCSTKDTIADSKLLLYKNCTQRVEHSKDTAA